MVVKLRLKRFGRLNHPTYRVCVADSRAPRDGRVIETLGYYLPKARKVDAQVKLDNERVQYWLSVGAQPSETVASLIKRAGGTLPQKSDRIAKARKARKRKVRPFVPPKKKGRAASGTAPSGSPASGSPASGE